MPAKKAQASKASMRKPRRYPRVPRQVRSKRGYNQPEWASLTEIRDSNANPISNTGQPYTLRDVNLSQFDRATQVAQGYQFFRIKRISVVFTPLVDTFIAPAQVGGNTATVPYLYYMIDRTNQIPTPFTADNLRAFGAKPRRLDDKTIVCSYTPSVLTTAFDNAPSSSPFVQYKMSPWLPTRDTTVLSTWVASTIDHMGLVWLVENIDGATLNYKVQIKVEFQFKKPAYNFTVPPPGVSAIDWMTGQASNVNENQ